MMGDGVLVSGVGCWGTRHPTEGYKDKDNPLDRNGLTPAGLSELEVDRSACWMGHFSPFVCVVIDCETVEDRHNSLRAGTDGPALLELTSSRANYGSAFGASGSQMGGRMGMGLWGGGTE